MTRPVVNPQAVPAQRFPSKPCSPSCHPHYISSLLASNREEKAKVFCLLAQAGGGGGGGPAEPPGQSEGQKVLVVVVGTLTHSQALAVDLVAPASVVPQGLDAAVQVDEEGLEEGLPRVQRLHRL